MAEYLCLIYEDEKAWEKAGPEDFEQVMKAHMEFGANNSAALRGGNALQPTGTATTIRTNASGKATVTDGPLAETKVTLGGYYLIEAKDMDEALVIAKQVPAAFGCVELRPIRVFD
jgi:hypothetical protein